MPVPSVRSRLAASRFSLLALLVASLVTLVLGAAPPAHAAWNTHGNAIWTPGSNTSLFEVQVAPDNAGGEFVAFFDYGGGQPRIYLQRVKGDGTLATGWASGGVLVCLAANSRSELQMVADGAGGVYLGWVDTRSLTNNPDIYLQHILANGTLAAGSWVANGNAIRVHSDDEGYLRLAADGTGGVIAAWKASGSKLMIQRVNASGAQLWTAGGVAYVNNAEFNASLDLIGDGAGGAYVSWNDLQKRLFADHVVAATGGIHWYPIPQVNPTGEGREPALAWDGGSGVFVAYRWAASFNANDQVTIQRVATVPNWSGNGFVACNATGDQYQLRIVPDGCSNAIVSWLDDRGGQGVGDVYTTKVQWNGGLSPGWTANGAALRTTSVNVAKTDLVMSADGRGGATYTWSENSVEVRGHHVHSQGGFDSAIPSGGRVLRNTSGTMSYARSALATPGVQVAAWVDARNSPVAIYANRMDVTVPTPVTLTLPTAAHWSIKATWSGPSDPNLGDPLSFVLSRSLSPLTEANFGGGIVVTGFSAGAPGADYCIQVDGLNACRTHYFGLKTTYACGDRYSFASKSTTCSGNTYVVCDGFSARPSRENRELSPSGFAVDTPFPNPAGAIATLGFDIPAADAGRSLEIAIFDLGGRRLRRIESGPAVMGRHALEWDLRTETGERVRAGLYFARFQLGDTRVTRPVLVR